MITPTRIEARNIRSIAHATVDIPPDGITALSGSVGQGKSSLLNTLLWVCWGEVGGIPGLLVQNEMRRTTCPDDEPAEGTVEFEVNGDHYVAVRRLRQRVRKGQTSEVASAELWINGDKQPQITPTKLTEKMVALTGMSGRAYAGAFFIPQNHLPALAEGTPAEVQRMVEDQTGLAALSKKVEHARAAANDAQVEADALPGSVEDVEAAQAEVDEAHEAGSRLWEALETANERASKTRIAADKASELHHSLQEKYRRAQEARIERDRVRTRREVTAEQVGELQEELRGLPAADRGDLQDAHATIKTALASAEQAHATARNAERGVQDAAEAARVAESACRDFSDSLDTDTATAKEHVDQLRDTVGAFRGEHQRLTRAVDAVRAVGPDAATCPTCTQSVPDANGLLRDLLRDLADVEGRGKQTNEDIKTAERVLHDLTQQQAGRDRAHQAAEHARQQATSAQQGLASARDASQTAVNVLAASLDVEDTDYAALETTAQERLNELATAIAASTRRETVETAIAEKQDNLSALDTAIKDLADQPGKDVSEAAVDAAATQAQEATAAHMVEDRARQQADTEAQVAAERARAAEDTRDKAKTLLDAKIDALTKADTLRHAARMLTELRRDLLTEYTELISAASSDLMHQVGGGEHVGVDIDEEFVPRVILADGTRRPMKVLSGGEKMRAALCLRLGIADQITGSSGAGTIFADEITANHDEETTAAVVELIRGLGRPMVVIAHASEVRQVATRVVDFTKADESTGTQVRALDDTAAVYVESHCSDTSDETLADEDAEPSSPELVP